MLPFLKVCFTGQCVLPLQPLSLSEQRPDNSQLERCTAVRRTLQTCSVIILEYQRRLHINAGERCALCPVFGCVSAGVLTAVNPDRRGTNSGSDVIRMAPVRQVWSRHSCLPETGSGAMSYFLAPLNPLCLPSRQRVRFL